MAGRRFQSWLMVGLAGALLVPAGCERSAPDASSAATAPAEATADATQPTPPTRPGHAPHEGTLIELGDAFAYLELVLDPNTGTLTGYVLDREGEQAVRLKQPEIAIEVNTVTRGDEPQQAWEEPVTVILKAVADPLTGETVGDTSEFTGQADILKGVSGFTGSVADITIKGVQFKDVPLSYSKDNDPHAAPH